MKHTLFILSLLFCFAASAQSEKKEIDPSQKTNLYSCVTGVGEITAADGYSLYGVRAIMKYAINSDNMLVAEAPFMYNDLSESFGISDIRVRYFWAVKRNISKKFIAIVPFADVTMPTGNADKGLGADTWSLAAGSIFGLVLGPKTSLFPGISAVYLTEAEQFGVGLQTNLSYKFTKKFFVFVNPLVTFTDDTIWSGELNFNYMLKPTLKLNAGWYPNFTAETNSFRAGVAFYL